MGIVRLHRLSKLQHYSLCATDGEIGTVGEAQFDDTAWTVRYFVARAGTWLLGRSVLISTIALGEIDDVAGVIHVQLPRNQIMDSPRLDEGLVTRGYEADFFRYYGWPPYWESAHPAAPYLPFQSSPPAEAERQLSNENHLRSTTEVSGYRIAAADGDIGHVADFVIDEKTWQITYLVIDTRTWLQGKHVLLNPAWIERIDWQDRRVITDLRRESIQTAPTYDQKSPVNRDYEVKLFEHYARKKYWEQRPL